MQANSRYPVKLTSRHAQRKRARKYTLAWCAVSVTLLLGGTSSLTPLFHGSQDLAQAPAAEPAVAQSSNTADMMAATNTAMLEHIVGAEPTRDPAPLADNSPVSHSQTYPLAFNLVVENGDTLISLLTDVGIDSDEAHRVVASIRKIYDPKKLDVGQSIDVTVDKNTSDMPVLKNLTLPVSALASLQVSRTSDNDFSVKKIDAPVERKLARVSGHIESSLYETGMESGIPASLLSELINTYSYDVDFQRDIKRGDGIDVLFERIETKEGDVAGHGNILFAQLDLGDRELKVYRYTDKNGNTDYYNERGESLRKALLRTPINGARITSGFGMRNHPLLGYTRMHRGVDFGAAIGTPIYAAGDGTVEFVGKKSGYGNYLRISHNNKYSSAYAHISRFASGIAPGHKVKQGQIVAYVGMSGMATGPHLHYEILVNNEQINPANVKFKTGNVLAGKDLFAFRKSMQKIETQLAAMPRNGNSIAMADLEKRISPN